MQFSSLIVAAHCSQHGLCALTRLSHGDLKAVVVVSQDPCLLHLASPDTGWNERYSLVSRDTFPILWGPCGDCSVSDDEE
ncbi:hypothetical protein HGM15179_006896 [Zosterops borbonicus]|uniref:Uncharacterized protein n=1 Tax=Zosterops borbonicus TaxID=364589 RepID=A0A8K1GJS6_9PASS|nr:hypothetical protein HGM15179_006896 [Zosterops borbonicus]